MRHSERASGICSSGSTAPNAGRAREYSKRPLYAIPPLKRFTHMPETVKSAPETALSDSVREALAISLRGCAELLPQADWVKKLQKWNLK